MKKAIILVSIFLLFSTQTGASEGDIASELARYFLTGTAVPDLVPEITIEEAMAIQKQYVAIIGETYGAFVGYKAGLTNEAVQKRFGVTHPLRGVLLKNMLKKSGTVMTAHFGARPLSEGDLLVRIKDEGINRAKTPQQALNHISEAIPFIELPDLVYQEGVTMNGARLSAINVGARYGITGDPVQISPTEEWFTRLGAFKLRILDEKGNILAEGQGSNLLGHPLNVILWIKDSLNDEGLNLKKGDLLSLGTITKLMPVEPNTTVRARYIGLDPAGPVEISVTFK